MGKEGKKKVKGGSKEEPTTAPAPATADVASSIADKQRAHKMETSKPTKALPGAGDVPDDTDCVRISLDLDQGKLEGLPLADVLAKLFMDDANRGTIGNNKTRAKYLAQTRKGRKIGEPIPLDIEITDLSDRSQHLSLPQQQMLEQHRKKAHARYSWARMRATPLSSMLDIQKITITLDVKLSEDIDDMEDEGKESMEHVKDAADPAADDKKKSTKEKKKAGSGKKKRKEEETAEAPKERSRPPLTKTISGRRMLLNGSKSGKAANAEDSGFRKTFSLVDVRSFFKRDTKEEKDDKLPKKEDPADGKKRRKDKKVDSAPTSLTQELITAKSKRPELRRESGGLRSIQSEDDFTSKLSVAEATKPSASPREPSPAPASTPRSFEDIPIPRLNEPWLLPELSEAEKAGTERQNEADADEGERGEATTIPGALFQMGEKHPLHPIYFTKSGVTHTWQFTTFADLSTLVRRVSSGLIALGMPPRARTAILSSNRLEWVGFCLGSMSAGAVPAALPTTSTTPEIARMLAIAQANVVVVEKREQCDALLSQLQLFPRLRHIVLLDGSASGYPADLVLTWRQLVAKGTYGNVNNAEFHSRLENLQPNHLASLVFTSGTTGLAKCAMLSHRNLMFSACAIGRLLAIEESDSLLSFLPFSHIAEQLLAIYVPIVARCRIYFAESTAKLHRNMRETQPTLVFAPPELWRKIYLAVQSKVPTSATQTMNAPALSALWTAMGFARVRYAACAYGHLPEDVCEYLQKLRFSLHEAYGQTETCGLTAVNTSGSSQVGTVGKVLPHTQVKIDAGGQILVKGNNVFMGYLSEDTRPVDGWWATGDHGSIDASGFVRLVGRRVELISSLNDKVLHPERIENALKMLPAINNVIVVGHHKPYLTAVISLDPYFMARVSKEKGVAAKALYKAPYINEITVTIQKHVVAVNKRLPRGFPTLKRFTVLRKQFSHEKGELTAAMQIRRFVVEKNYEKEIDKMYADAIAVAPQRTPATGTSASGSTQHPPSTTEAGVAAATTGSDGADKAPSPREGVDRAPSPREVVPSTEAESPRVDAAASGKEQVVEPRAEVVGKAPEMRAEDATEAVPPASEQTTTPRSTQSTTEAAPAEEAVTEASVAGVVQPSPRSPHADSEVSAAASVQAEQEATQHIETEEAPETKLEEEAEPRVADQAEGGDSGKHTQKEDEESSHAGESKPSDEPLPSTLAAPVEQPANVHEGEEPQKEDSLAASALPSPSPSPRPDEEKRATPRVSASPAPSPRPEKDVTPRASASPSPSPRPEKGATPRASASLAPSPRPEKGVTPRTPASSSPSPSPRPEKDASPRAPASVANDNDEEQQPTTSQSVSVEPSPRAVDADSAPMPLDELKTEPEPSVEKTEVEETKGAVEQTKETPLAEQRADEEVQGEVASDVEKGETTNECSSSPETDSDTTSAAETETETETESEREGAQASTSSSRKPKQQRKRRPHEEDDDSAIDGDGEHEEEDEPRSSASDKDELARSTSQRRLALAALNSRGVATRSVSPRPDDSEHEKKSAQLGLVWQKEKELSETEERKLEDERRAQSRRELIERKVDMKSTMAMFQMLAKTSTAPVPHQVKSTTKRGGASSSTATSSGSEGHKSDRSSASESESQP